MALSKRLQEVLTWGNHVLGERSTLCLLLHWVLKIPIYFPYWHLPRTQTWPLVELLFFFFLKNCNLNLVFTKQFCRNYFCFQLPNLGHAKFLQSSLHDRVLDGTEHQLDILGVYSIMFPGRFSNVEQHSKRKKRHQGQWLKIRRKAQERKKTKTLDWGGWEGLPVAHVKWE